MRVRAFDLRIQHVFVPLRKTRRLCNTGQHARQRKEKRVARIGARRFFTARNAPFHVTVNVVRYAWLTHGRGCQPVLGPLHLFQSVLRPSKQPTIKHVQDQNRSVCRMAQPGEPSICVDNDLHHLKKQISAPHESCHARIHLISGQEIDKQATEADNEQQQDQTCARAASEPRTAHEGRQSLIE